MNATLEALEIGELRQLPLGMLEADPDWERTPGGSLNADELASLSASIKQRGQLEPIRVFPIEGGKFQISSGHRRVTATRMAGKKTIKCYVVARPPDVYEQALDRLTSNIQRRDLTPIELARAFKLILDRDPSLTEDDLAEQFKIKNVGQHLALLRLPEEVQEMINQAQLSLRDGIRLLRGVTMPGYMENNRRSEYSVEEMQIIIARALAKRDTDAERDAYVRDFIGTQAKRIVANDGILPLLELGTATEVPLDPVVKNEKWTPSLAAETLRERERFNTELWNRGQEPVRKARELERHENEQKRQREMQQIALAHGKVLAQRGDIATDVINDLFCPDEKVITLDLLKLTALVLLESRTYMSAVETLAKIDAATTNEELIDIIGSLALDSLQLDDEMRVLKRPHDVAKWANERWHIDDAIRKAQSDAGIYGRPA